MVEKADFVSEQNHPEEKPPAEDGTSNKAWLKMGMKWAFLMWISMSILLPIYTDIEFSLELVLINLPICFGGGLLFGFGMKWISRLLKPSGMANNRTQNNQ